MKNRIIILLIITLLSMFTANGQKGRPIDSEATRETVNLFKNLEKLSRNHILFGHQHATEYGHGWSGDVDSSDVKSVTESHPGVIGIYFSGFTGRSPESVKKYKEDIKKIVVDAYNRGGVITAAWHFSNPVSKGGFYWVDTVSLPAVRYIIPGGEAHEK
jgi:mannan endo-1,4-beta-mannosidase